MSGVHHDRTIARRKALQILYQAELTGTGPAQVLADGEFIDELGIPCQFTARLVTTLPERSAEIDALIASASANWSIDRIALVDRCILRLATHEMLYIDEVPISVSVNEAVELARIFGGEDDSPRFINGVLGSIARTLAAALASDPVSVLVPDSASTLASDLVPAPMSDPVSVTIVCNDKECEAESLSKENR
ncbi:MAG: transcription antitermination factor NusB [Coriobacteriales bacterium]|jgi:N utilization substance protein B|nr:transcription antitermination factor NusB [Coriobacteriales bacterium]